MNTTTLTVRVASDVADRLKKLAEATQRSRSFLAAEAIEEYLSLQEWQVQAIQEGIAAINNGQLVDFDQVKQAWEQRLED